MFISLLFFLSNGCANDGGGSGESDAIVPTHAAASVNFTDTYPDTGELAGDVDITKAV